MGTLVEMKILLQVVKTIVYLLKIRVQRKDVLNCGAKKSMIWIFGRDMP